MIINKNFDLKRKNKWVANILNAKVGELKLQQ
jgi:hypothetical protein